MASSKKFEDKVFEKIYDKYLKEKETPSPSTSGEGNKPASINSPSGEDSKKPEGVLPVYKIPYYPVRMAEPSSTSREREKKPKVSSSPSTPMKKSSDYGNLIALGIIASMFVLPFLLLADWDSIKNWVKVKGNLG